MAPENAAPDDCELVLRILAHDESAFSALVDRYHGALLRLATALVSNRAVAEEVVQETWLGVLQGLPRFDWRSSLDLDFRILANRAITRRQREGRTVPFSALGDGGEEGPGPDVDRFGPDGRFAAAPATWEGEPLRELLGRETLAVIERELAQLPPGQRSVVTLRDIEGLDSAEVCNILGISEINQRVLLHRGRARLRRALESHFTGTQAR